MSDEFSADVCVMGGAGHVGLPLAVALASVGLRVVVFDIDESATRSVAEGRPPFLETGIETPLRRALAEGLLRVTTDPSSTGTAEHLVVVVGTPVDEYLSPDPGAVPRTLEEVLVHLRPGQLVVLRSTVYPGVTRRVERLLASSAPEVDLAFCPERIAEGRAMTELFDLPQIVAARSPRACERAAALFGRLTQTVVELDPEEAELAKLFTNAWRYIKFAAANQFYEMANDLGVDFASVRDAMREDYPRAADLPAAGFAAGPCLFKDTMQLGSVVGGTFALGHAAMLVNEGLPDYVVRRLEQVHDLDRLTVGILGMSFKSESDDTRSSLSYRLKRLLAYRAGGVLTTDPYVATDPEILPLEEVLARSDLLVLAAPHAEYRDLATTLPVVDVWNHRGQGSRV